tara:strand:+ start:105 stop:320 length:216 start_codon:yes stop_codon:yes gene_type:complete
MSEKLNPKLSAELERKLLELKAEHRRIDNILLNPEDQIRDTFLIKRLKKQKLFLKDKIKQVTNALTPDIIA